MKHWAKLLVLPATVAAALLLPCDGLRGATADSTAVERTANLIANGDFFSKDPDQRPLRWTTSPMSQAIVSSRQHHDASNGGYSLEIIGSTNKSTLVRSEKHVAAPGTIYDAAAWVKTTGDAPATFWLEFWNQNNRRIGVTSATPAASSDWQKVHLALEAPDQVTHVTVAIGCATNQIGVSYWNDVTLVPQVPYDAKLKPGVRELFLDDYRIADLMKVQRVVHPGEKSRPLITPTEPWEGRAVYIYGTVLKDQPPGTGYRMWYTTFHGGYFLCYATSEDGIHWKKPALNIIDFGGSKSNNITHMGGGTLVYDPDDPDPDRRYKLMDYASKPAEKRGYSVYFSADGLHWTAYAKNPVITYGDVSNMAYDRKARLFIASTKQRMLAANTSVTPGKQDRDAFISVSTNFTEWHAPGAPESQWLLGVEGDPQDDLRVMSRGGIEAQIYGMPIYPYEGVYIGLPWVFDIMNYTTGIYASAGDGPIQPELAVSRDLRLWSRPDRDPVIPLGKNGAWDCGTLYTASTLLLSSNTMEIYFGAMNLGHGGDRKAQLQTACIGKATWRRDGFVSLHNAGDDPGVITTKPIEFQNASQLCINAVLAPDGSLQAEILHEDGTPVSGFDRSACLEVTGDHLAEALRWNDANDLSQFSGQPIRLRFFLKDGDLYSYWFQ